MTAGGHACIGPLPFPLNLTPHLLSSPRLPRGRAALSCGYKRLLAVPGGRGPPLLCQAVWSPLGSRAAQGRLREDGLAWNEAPLGRGCSCGLGRPVLAVVIHTISARRRRSRWGARTEAASGTAVRPADMAGQACVGRPGGIRSWPQLWKGRRDSSVLNLRPPAGIMVKPPVGRYGMCDGHIRALGSNAGTVDSRHSEHSTALSTRRHF